MRQNCCSYAVHRNYKLPGAVFLLADFAGDLRPPWQKLQKMQQMSYFDEKKFTTP